MNPALPSALLCLALTGSVAAGEADELRKLGAGVFTTAGEVTEINLNRSKITDTQLKLVATFPKLTDLSLEQTKVTGKGLAHLTRLAKLAKHELEPASKTISRRPLAISLSGARKNQ